MKMSRDQGYVLLQRLVNHWTMEDYALEDFTEFRDNMMHEIGKSLYESALLWDKGTASAHCYAWSRKQFCLQDFSRRYNYDDEFCVDGLAHVILDLVVTVIRPCVDVDVKLKDVVIQTETVSKVKSFYVCPNCSYTNKIPEHRMSEAVTCYSCKSTFNLIDKKENQDGQEEEVSL